MIAAWSEQKPTGKKGVWSTKRDRDADRLMLEPKAYRPMADRCAMNDDATSRLAVFAFGEFLDTEARADALGRTER